MVDKDLEISTEPLWTIPAPIQERLNASLKDREYNHFLLCGLYSAVAIAFLMLFGLAALYRGDLRFASVIFGFAVATFSVYITAWFSRSYGYAKHLLTLLMFLLSLYLFYTGGTDNTGPLYYFIFPLVAIFLQGLRLGITSVVTLLLCTLVFYAGAFGFDTTRYAPVLFARIMAIYVIVSALAVVFEFFRVRAERDLLVSIDDLNQLIYGDLVTNLANRRLLERLLVAELARIKRYPSPFCVMFVEPDYLRVHTARYGVKFAHMTHQWLAGLLHRHLREPDVPGTWDDARYLVLLPATTEEGAKALAERLVAACAAQDFVHQGNHVRFSISVGIGVYQGGSPAELIALAANNLAQARREGGSRIVVV
ncbi:MAG TPA: GGDEF domain-containing protein [Candidatus Acidoferrum sp.]|nr:GGDEF domain-containing protein [Candidatus Acidoferrum sp.]